MAHQPVMCRYIPLAPVLVKVKGVPPVFVEGAVSEEGNFSEEVESAVEEGVEH